MGQRLKLTGSVTRSGKLTLGDKIARLSVRLRDPEWRRYAGLLAVGKLFGIALVLGVVFFGPGLLKMGPAFFGGRALQAPNDHSGDCSRHDACGDFRIDGGHRSDDRGVGCSYAWGFVRQWQESGHQSD